MSPHSQTWVYLFHHEHRLNIHHSSLSSRIWCISGLIPMMSSNSIALLSQHHLNAQCDYDAINTLIGVIDRLLELDRAEVRARWHHIDGLLPVFGSFKRSQIQLIVSSTGRHPTRKSTLRNVMKYFLESRYRVLSLFLDLPARRSLELLANAHKHFVASFSGRTSHPPTCSLVLLG